VTKIFYDDLELISNVLDGDIHSFSNIIYKYEFSIFKFIQSMIKDADTAKDLTQEVFITVYNKLYTYRGSDKFSNWIYMIAKNKSLDYLRKNRKIIELSIESAWYIQSKELLPEQWVELNEMKEHLLKFIKSLDDTDKQILILKSQNGNIKFNDIAEILKINVSTVKTKYYRLWDKYKRYLAEGSY
jgi:RNA polymerase sigma-70 factor, ECF subfamily